MKTNQTSWFHVKIPKKVHKKIKAAAADKGETLSQFLIRVAQKEYYQNSLN